MNSLQIAGTDLRVSAFALGLGDFGTRVRGAEATAVVAHYLERGGTFFDTAHCYSFWVPGGDGASEAQLGRSLRELGCRDQVIVGTKGGHCAVGEGYPRPDLYMAPERVSQDLAESLERLDMDRVDVYYLHRDDPRVPVGEVMDGLNREIVAGRVGYLGASNWSVTRLSAANEYATANRLQGFVFSQVHFSLADPQWDMTTDPTTRYLTPSDLQWHAGFGLAVAAYTPQATGFFAGRPAAEGGYGAPSNLARRERARELAEHLDCTATQVAIAWLLHQPFPVFPILGTYNVARMDEALGALDVALTPAQIAWLRG
jgi:aryl-alcohol dehydrogenase-like predicted oxidoreductase